MTAITLVVGSLTDALGLRRTFIIGAWICVVARAVMGFASFKWLAVPGGLFLLAAGEALGTPVLVAGSPPLFHNQSALHFVFRLLHHDERGLFGRQFPLRFCQEDHGGTWPFAVLGSRFEQLSDAVPGQPCSRTLCAALDVSAAQGGRSY